jgi:hypothetical protein
MAPFCPVHRRTPVKFSMGACTPNGVTSGEVPMRWKSVYLAPLLLILTFCKQPEPRNAPSNQPSVSPSSTYNPYAIPSAPAGGTAPLNTNPSAQGVGCVGDSEPVPMENEKALRDCCEKLGSGKACQQSKCWAKGQVAAFQSHLQPGGECAQ